MDQLPDELRYDILQGASAEGAAHNWSLVGQSTPEQPRQIHVARGKVTGGSSAINYLIMLRGTPEDMDGWAAAGNDEWSYQRTLPYFRRLESDVDIRDDFHGSDGPIPVWRHPRESWLPLHSAFYQACRDAGFPDDPDMNHPDATGVGAMPLNNPDGVRMSTAIAYLESCRHRLNLTIRPNALARRILFEGRRATGVEVDSGGETFVVEGEEIILSAGAIHSPHLLLLSGVGPADELLPHNIDLHSQPARRGPEHEEPSVGQYRLSLPPGPPADAGHAAEPGWPAIQRRRVRAQRHPGAADHVLPGQPAAAGHPVRLPAGIPVQRGSIEPDPRRRLRPAPSRLPIPHRPEGPLAGFGRPCVVPSPFSTTLQLCDGLLAERLAPTDEDLASDAALDCWLQQNAGIAGHTSVTCKMGPASDPLAVVDQRCRVHGMEGLRVVDAAAMPDIVRANTNATIIMLAERVADFILEGK